MPEIRAVTVALSKEMMKAGMIEEGIDETFESLDEPDIDEAAEDEVNAIMEEVLTGVPLSVLTHSSRPSDAKSRVGAIPSSLPLGAEDAEADDEDDLSVQRRLQALKAAE